MERPTQHIPTLQSSFVPAAGPRVSVIIPAFNSAKYISETLKSVFAQSYTSYEIILVNDGSPDTAEFENEIEPYSDRITYLKQENSGSASARNLAIGKARGEIVAFLDADDIWFPGYLNDQVEIFDKRGCDLLYCDAALFGEVKSEKETFMRNSPSAGSVTTESLISARCNIITSGTIAFRERLVECGLFDDSLPPLGFEDYDLWFRMAKRGLKLDYHHAVLLKYRVRSDSLSGSSLKIAERDVIGLDYLESRYKLSESEKKTLDERRIHAVAFFNLKKAKQYLSEENVSTALEHLRLAQTYFQTAKLKPVIWLLSFSPKLALKILRLVKPDIFTLPSAR